MNVHLVMDSGQPGLKSPITVDSEQLNYMRCHYTLSMAALPIAAQPLPLEEGKQEATRCPGLYHTWRQSMATRNDPSRRKDVNPQANPDPITGAPGAHPVGTGLGTAAGGIAAGAAAGALAGPAGAVVGAVVGGVAGGLAGKSLAENIDPTLEEAYWEENFSSRPYYNQDSTFDEYRPAYRYGVDSHTRYRGRSFEAAEPELAAKWETSRGKSTLGWEKAKLAARDAWDRIERALPGDADRDGR